MILDEKKNFNEDDDDKNRRAITGIWKWQSQQGWGDCEIVLNTGMMSF
jgi:hypothetical protein